MLLLPKGLRRRSATCTRPTFFYNPDPTAFDRMEAMGVLAVEMETAGLYGAAAEKGARALTICTVSDHVRTGESTSSEEREQTFSEMVEIALETVRTDTTP